jgi:hypothetical protein
VFPGIGVGIEPVGKLVPLDEPISAHNADPGTLHPVEGIIFDHYVDVVLAAAPDPYIAVAGGDWIQIVHKVSDDLNVLSVV